MKKALRTLTLASVMTLAAQAAFATERNNERPRHEGNGRPETTQQQTANGGRGGNGGNGTGVATANGTGVGTGIATANGTGTGIANSGSQSGATAQTGPITNTNGASASTGPVTNTNLNGAAASTGPVSVETGPVNTTTTATGGNATGGNATGGNATGGQSNASTGPVNVAPNQSTVNTFRSFVGTNAPNLSGAVDNCLAVLGWSAAVNVFGNTGVGLGGGNQRAEYVEQCAAVKSAFEVWNRANGDINKETFAIDLLIKALPKYGQPAMDSAVARINTYIETNGTQEPDSVMNIFGAKAFTKKAPAAPADQAPAAPQPPAQQAQGVTVVINPVVHTKETVRTVAAQPKKAAPAKAPCDCKP